MAIKFFNIRSREVRTADTEPLITAMWASSDRSPNITQGQDFGWRLAPEVVVEMKRIKNSFEKLQEIAVKYGIPLDAVGEPEILTYISDKTSPADAQIAQEGDYTDEYDQEIRRLELEDRAKAEMTPVIPTSTVETTESLADLEKRVELEERLAAAHSKSEARRIEAQADSVHRVAEATTPSPVPTTTTTTTVAPKSTTTTTKKR